MMECHSVARWRCQMLSVVGSNLGYTIHRFDNRRPRSKGQRKPIIVTCSVKTVIYCLPLYACRSLESSYRAQLTMQFSDINTSQVSAEFQMRLRYDWMYNSHFVSHLLLSVPDYQQKISTISRLGKDTDKSLVSPLRLT